MDLNELLLDMDSVIEIEQFTCSVDVVVQGLDGDGAPRPGLMRVTNHAVTVSSMGEVLRIPHANLVTHVPRDQPDGPTTLVQLWNLPAASAASARGPAKLVLVMADRRPEESSVVRMMDEHLERLYDCLGGTTALAAS